MAQLYSWNSIFTTASSPTVRGNFITTMKKSMFTIIMAILLIACNSTGSQKNNTLQSDSLIQSVSKAEQLANHFSIVGDFNGDKILDTIFESYKSSITNKEIPKDFDSEEAEKNIELIMKYNPVTSLYSSITGVDVSGCFFQQFVNIVKCFEFCY
jgi:hypothetical protein